MEWNRLRKLTAVLAMAVVLVMASIPAFGKTVKFKIDTFFIEPTHFSQTVKYWAELVEKETGGRIKFDMYYANQLIVPPDQWDATAKGIVQVTDIATSYVSSKVRDLAPIELPVLTYETFQEARTRVNPVLDEIAAQEGLKLIFSMNCGEAIFIHRSKLLKTPDDFKGQVYRAAGRWQNRWMELLGASPTFISAGELYQAIQRGTVKGGFIISLMVPAFKLDEPAPYMTFLGAPPPNIQMVVMNLKAFNSLSPKDQEILLKAGKDAERMNWELTTGFDAKIMDQMKAKGRHVHRLTKGELKPFFTKALPMWDEVRKASGPLGNKLVDVLEKYKP